MGHRGKVEIPPHRVKSLQVILRKNIVYILSKVRRTDCAGTLCAFQYLNLHPPAERNEVAFSRREKNCQRLGQTLSLRWPLPCT